MGAWSVTRSILPPVNLVRHRFKRATPFQKRSGEMMAVDCKFLSWQMFFAWCTPLVRKTLYTERDMINGNVISHRKNKKMGTMSTTKGVSKDASYLPPRRRWRQKDVKNSPTKNTNTQTTTKTIIKKTNCYPRIYFSTRKLFHLP